MDQLVNTVNYDVVRFDPRTGVLEVYIREMESSISIEVPIENNKYITGDALLSYIAGFIPVHALNRKQEIQTVTNTHEFKQFIKDSSNEATLSQTIRDKRHGLLLECDWVMMPDAGFSGEQIERFKKYRQQLRDVPQQPGFPHDVVWPVCDGEWMNHPGVVRPDELT